MTLWERFTHWMVKDFYTLEERALMIVEAERLKLKTDLQRARIEKLLARQEEAKKIASEARESFRTVAVWKLPCIVNGTPAYEHFYLQQTKDPVDKDKYYRRVLPGPIVAKKDSRVIVPVGTVGPFEQSNSVYINYVLPWNEWTISSKDLKACDEITVLK